MLMLAAVALLLSAPDEKKISIYSKAANYSLPITQKNGQDCAGLLEILEPLGTVSAKADGQRWKVRFNNVDGEFTAGKPRARIRGHDFDLHANFLIENGRGLIPLASLTQLLPQFLGGPVIFHETSRRLFIGDVSVHFIAQVNKSNPPALVMNFTSPVNPSISTEPGKLRLLFTHEPLVPSGSQTLTFDSKIIPSATYQEENGAAELTIAGTAPLFARFSNDGRTITVTAAPQVTAQAPPQPTAAPPSVTGSSSTTTTVPISRRYFAVVDASHGGDERGAAISDQLAEKDVTLAFARRLRQELEARGLTTLLLRDGDTSLTLDQRANIANSNHPAIYICVHASSQGYGIRLYKAMVPSVADSHGPFLDWSSAQAPFFTLSQSAATSVAAEFQRREIAVRTLIAPLRPLNSIIAAAVAVEVAPRGPSIAELNDPEYQQSVTAAVATGLSAVRAKLEAGR